MFSTWTGKVVTSWSALWATGAARARPPKRVMRKMPSFMVVWYDAPFVGWKVNGRDVEYNLSVVMYLAYIYSVANAARTRP